MCNPENMIGRLQVDKAFDAIVVNIRYASSPSPSPVSPHNLIIWGVGDDENGGSRRGARTISVWLMVTRRRVWEWRSGRGGGGAMLERFLFCGDNGGLNPLRTFQRV